MIVATVRALKMHGGVAREQLGKENLEALRKGMANLARHVQNVRRFGVPAVVAINHFTSDTRRRARARCASSAAASGVEAVICRHWAERRRRHRARSPSTSSHLCESGHRLDGRGFQLLYPDEMPLWDKMKTIATKIYGADDIIADKTIRARFAELQEQGYGHYPICVAKTQYSFSTDPNLKGAPSHHVVPIREVRLANGAEFVVAICGDIMTMPGLPRVPAANQHPDRRQWPGRGPVLIQSGVPAAGALICPSDHAYRSDRSP